MAEMESLPYNIIDNDEWVVSSLLAKQKIETVEGIPLKEIVDFNPVRINESEIKDDSEYNYIDSSCISEDGILLNTKRMSGDELPARARLIVQKGDILISTVRPERNLVAVITDNFDGSIVTTAFAVLRPKKLETAVLYFLLRSEQYRDQITALSKGGTVPTIKLKDLKDIEVPINCFNESVELEAQDLFTTWIEQNAKVKTIQQVVEDVFTKNVLLNSEDELIQQSKVYQVYPYDKLKDRLDVSFYMNKSQHDWSVNVKALKDIAIEFRAGAAIPSKEYKENGAAYVRIKDLKENRISEEELVYVDKKYEDKNIKSVLSQNEILISRVGTIGKAALVDKEMDGALANQHLTILKADSAEVLPQFLVYYFNTTWAEKQFARRAGGAAQQFIKLGAIKEIKVPVPKIELQLRVISEVEKELELMDKTIIKNMIEEFSSALIH